MTGEDQPIRQTIIHRALHRPQLVMGGERELTLFSMIVAGGLIISALNLVATIVGGSLWVICLAVLRRMAKADPQMSQIYVRQLRYAVYYPAFSRPWRVSSSKRIY